MFTRTEKNFVSPNVFLFVQDSEPYAGNSLMPNFRVRRIARRLYFFRYEQTRHYLVAMGLEWVSGFSQTMQCALESISGCTVRSTIVGKNFYWFMSKLLSCHSILLS